MVYILLRKMCREIETTQQTFKHRGCPVFLFHKNSEYTMATQPNNFYVMTFLDIFLTKKSGGKKSVLIFSFI